MNKLAGKAYFKRFLQNNLQKEEVRLQNTARILYNKLKGLKTNYNIIAFFSEAPFSNDFRNLLVIDEYKKLDNERIIESPMVVAIRHSLKVGCSLATTNGHS